MNQRSRTPLLLALFLLLAPPLAGQSGSGLGNMHLADTKNKDPALVAAQHLARAEQALGKAKRLHEEGAGDPKQAKKAEKACRRAEREASAALAGDAGLVQAYFVRGQARLLLGEAAGAREDCLQMVSFQPANAQALLCYGQASLQSGEGGQGLSAYAKLRDLGGETELEARLLADLRTWIDANPEGEAEQNAARWLEERGVRLAEAGGGS